MGNPLNKTPRASCKLNSDYDILDSTNLPDDYLPRTNYIPDCDADEYRRRTPRVTWRDRSLLIFWYRWHQAIYNHPFLHEKTLFWWFLSLADFIENERGEKKPVTDFYRLVCRRQLSQSGERTLIPAVAPKQSAHIHPVISTTFRNQQDLVVFCGFCSSVAYDFYIKTTGKSDLYESTLRLLPLPDATLQLRLRTLASTASPLTTPNSGQTAGTLPTDKTPGAKPTRVSKTPSSATSLPSGSATAPSAPTMPVVRHSLKLTYSLRSHSNSRLKS